MSNPVDDFLEEKEKRAGWLKNLGRAFVTGLGGSELEKIAVSVLGARSLGVSAPPRWASERPLW
jgi:hypothetical protein